MGGAPAARGPRSTGNFLPRCVDVCWRLKKVVNFLGEEKCTPKEKILGTRMRKGPSPFVGMGPRMVDPALVEGRARRQTFHKGLSPLAPKPPQLFNSYPRWNTKKVIFITLGQFSELGVSTMARISYMTINTAISVSSCTSLLYFRHTPCGLQTLVSNYLACYNRFL